MVYMPIEELLEKTDSVYKLVILAAKRAVELNQGSSALVKIDSKKPTTIALEEIRQGRVALKTKKKEH